MIPNPEIHIINTIDELKQLVEYVNESEFEYCVVDTETDSAIPQKANLYGIGLAFNETEAFYIPFRSKDTNLLWIDDLTPYLLNMFNRKILGHNICYDEIVIENTFNISIVPYLHADTILLKHTISEEPPNGLKEVAVAYLGPWADKAKEKLVENIKANGGKTTKENMEMYKADTLVLAEYCAWDCLLTLMLYNKLSPMLEKEGLVDFFYKEEVMPLYKKVTIPMNKKGFPVSTEHFEHLRSDILKDITSIKILIYAEIETLVQPLCRSILSKEFAVKPVGKLAKRVGKLIDFTLPTSKLGEVSLAKSALKKMLIPKSYQHKIYLEWLLDQPINENILDVLPIVEAQSELYFEKYPDEEHIFNLNSNDHLRWLLVDCLGEEALKKTDGGKDKVDDDFLETLKDKYGFVKNLIEYKKLNKLYTTYIQGIIERIIDGKLYTSLLQFGTTSGRYSSHNPNLQNLPRVKGDDSGISELVLKYSNAIKEGFIAPEGYDIVDADQSQLEPRCFAAVANDEALLNIFRTGEDFYASIAKRVFNLPGSTYKKDKDFIGTIYPEKRQLCKTMALAVAYGAQANRLADLMGIEVEEAQELVNSYFKAYPKLKEYIQLCHQKTKTNGYVRNMFGRIRHLKEAKDIYLKHGDNIQDRYYVRRNQLKDEAYKFRTLLNNSTNFPIQSLAGSIMNRSMIEIQNKFDHEHLDAYQALQIHDQVITICAKKDTLRVKNIIKDCMENTIKLPIPLIAEPKVASNLKESK